MYVDTSTVRQGQKTYTRHLLRESYRDENGKVKHKTIANLGACSQEEIQAIRLALRHKQNLSELGNTLSSEAIILKQGASYGAVHVVHEMAKRLGIVKALGSDRNGQLALWQVIARVIDQGSRLSAVRLAKTHAVAEIIDLKDFNENHLYANLDWLAEKQSEIEQRLFNTQEKSDGLFLYDVTSSYFEGEQNALAAFGYNRDKKRGKKQIVIGLLCNSAGRPLAIEVFHGNTQDTKTFASQIKKVTDRFGGGAVTFVGDRGMIKKPQIDDLKAEDFHFITAITKAQIETLIKQNILQLNLFDTQISEVIDDDSTRYILRRNPMRTKEIAQSRNDKYVSLQKLVDKANTYLNEHPGASSKVQLNKLQERAVKLRIQGWVCLSLTEKDARVIQISQNIDILKEISVLDGCYALKTDLRKDAATKETIHDRYKDLKLVEWAFRESKSMHLEMRPIHVRLEAHTRGHALIVMLAYTIIKALAENWHAIEATVQEGIDQLATLCLTEIQILGKTSSCGLPVPRKNVQELLDAVNVKLPAHVAPKASGVHTKVSLVNSRK